jgi:hypothetical protein
MTSNVAVDRDALYYPFIHITDVNWLKATLLCFPGVRRMVPHDYVTSDSDEVREFCETVGPRHEPLLSRVNLFSPEATEAEENLLAKLKQHDDEIRGEVLPGRDDEDAHAEAAVSVARRENRPELLQLPHVRQ